MKKLNPILEKRAVDLYAHTPNIKHSEVAKQLEISDKTLLKLRKDGNFWDKVYSTFMQSFEGELPDILRAMCREAKAGNQMAARLVLEHSGKLQKNIHVTIASPFEQWLARSENNQIEEAEIVLDKLPQKTAEIAPNKAHIMTLLNWRIKRRFGTRVGGNYIVGIKGQKQSTLIQCQLAVPPPDNGKNGKRV